MRSARERRAGKRLSTVVGQRILPFFVGSPNAVALQVQRYGFVSYVQNMVHSSAYFHANSLVNMDQSSLLTKVGRAVGHVAAGTCRRTLFGVRSPRYSRSLPSKTSCTSVNTTINGRILRL